MKNLIYVGINDYKAYWDYLQSHMVTRSTKQAGTAHMVFDDTEGTLDINPLDEIVVCNEDRRQRYFAGRINDIQIDRVGVTKRYVCDCVDYNMLATKRHVNEIYEDISSRLLLCDICQNHMTEIDAAGIANDGDEDDYVVLPLDAKLEPDFYTLYIRVILNTSAIGHQPLISKYQDPGSNYYGVQIWADGDGDVYLYHGYGRNSGFLYIPYDSLPPRGENHVIDIVAAHNIEGEVKTLQFWANGDARTTSIAKQVDWGGTPNWQIGRGIYQGDYVGCDATILRVKMWDKSLTWQECKALSLGQSIDDHEENLVLNMRLNEGTGSTAVDSSVNSFDGTITGMSWAYPYMSEEGETITHVPFRQRKASLVLDKICALNSWQWFIDSNKVLHAEPDTQADAPFGLSDSPDNSTTYPYELKRYKKDAKHLVNRVTVRGGVELSDNQYRYYPTGPYDEASPVDSELLVNLLYRLHAQTGQDSIQVWSNIGTDSVISWDPCDVGIEFINDSFEKEGPGDYDLLFNFQEKRLRHNITALSLPKGSLRWGYKIYCRIEKPVLVTIRSQSSYDQYGVWVDRFINDTSISSKAAAVLRAKEELARYQWAEENGVVVFTEDGVRCGDYIPIVSAKRGIDGTYYIHELTTRWLGNEIAEYTAKFGLFDPDLLDIIRQMRAETDELLDISDTTLLNELFMLVEAIEITEDSVAVLTGSTEAYTWGVDDDAGEWSYFTWS